MAAFMAVDATADAKNATLQILQLPSTTTIQGPPQAQNTFLTNPTVSQELNLLRGTGGATEVLYGNLLTLPFGGGLLYVEPVYVQPREETSGRFPTLQKVLVLYGQKVGFGDNLDDALRQVFGEASPNQPTDNQTPTGTAAAARDPGPAGLGHHGPRQGAEGLRATPRRPCRPARPTGTPTAPPRRS